MYSFEKIFGKNCGFKKLSFCLCAAFAFTIMSSAESGGRLDMGRAQKMSLFFPSQAIEQREFTDDGETENSRLKKAKIGSVTVIEEDGSQTEFGFKLAEIIKSLFS